MRSEYGETFSDATFGQASRRFERAAPVVEQGFPRGRGGVLTFDAASFSAACAELMHRACQRVVPDLLIGIRTGGMLVAQEMCQSVDERVPLLPVTLRRPSSRAKQKSAAVRLVLSRLPMPVLDWLRVVEHRLLTMKSHPPRVAGEWDLQEMRQLREQLWQMRPAPAILVVDDAVDSGATLLQVVNQLRRIAPVGGSIRSAVITVTTANPLITPDVALYRRQLCRFPWSLDAA